MKLIKILKNKLKHILLSLLIMSSAWNAYYSVINFIATNLSIRESFYFTNDVDKKGTHWGSENYRLTTRRHKLELVKFKFLDVISSFSKVNNIDPHNSNFEKEYQLISLLFFIKVFFVLINNGIENIKNHKLTKNEIALTFS